MPHVSRTYWAASSRRRYFGFVIVILGQRPVITDDHAKMPLSFLINTGGKSGALKSSADCAGVFELLNCKRIRLVRHFAHYLHYQGTPLFEHVLCDSVLAPRRIRNTNSSRSASDCPSWLLPVSISAAI